jgi:hypothetical protein
MKTPSSPLFLTGTATLVIASLLLAQTPSQTPPQTRPGPFPIQQVTSAPGDAHDHKLDAAGQPGQPNTFPPLVKSTQPVTPDEKNSWFKQTSLHLGTHFQESLLTGEFEFQNPNAADNKITNVLPSCGCTSSWFEIEGKTIPIAKPFEGEVVVPAGKACKLKVQMDMKGYVGVKEADIRVQTNDPNMAFVSLKLRAEAKVFFEVNPETVNLGELHYSDKREFAVNVTSPHAKDWKITRFEGLPPKMTVTPERIVEGDRVRYVIRGTYGPGIEEGTGGGSVTFYTDVENKKFEVRVSGFVVGPLQVTPGTFLAFGNVPAGTTKKLDVEFLCKDGNHKLKITNVEFMNLQNGSTENFDYEVAEKDEGKKLVLSVRIKENAPVGKTGGVIKVSTNHDLAKFREFRFNAFVR